MNILNFDSFNEGFFDFLKKKSEKKIEPLYKVISREEFNNYWDSKISKIVELSNRDRNKLFNSFKDIERNFYKKGNPIRKNLYHPGTSYIFSHGDKHCEIINFDDEWILMSFYTGATGDKNYYICDTIDGVIQVLSNKSIR